MTIARALPLVLEDNLQTEIASTPELAELIANKKIKVTDVAALLDRLNLLLITEGLADKKKILLENIKLAVMQAVEKRLDDLDYFRLHIEPVVEKKPSRVLHWLKVGFLSLFALIGLTETSVMTFLGAQVLLTSLFATIPLPAMLTVAILFTAINAIQFIGFQVGNLKNMVGVTSTTAAKQLIETHDKQVDITARINHRLTDVNVITHLTVKQYGDFKNIALKCNQDVELKKVSYHAYKEHPAKKGLRLGFTVFGAMMAIIGSYFGATMFLTTMAPAILGSPLGWIMIGGLVASSVVFYLSMQARGLMDMFNPWKKLFDGVKEKVKAFHTIDEGEFNHVLLNKKIFKREESPEVSQNIQVLDLQGVNTKTHDNKLFARRRSLPVVNEPMHERGEVHRSRPA